MPSPARSLTSRRVGRVGNSLTLEITARAAEMRAQGQDVVAFAAGEPDFDAPEYVKEAAFKAIKDVKGKYTAAMGLIELRKAVARKFAEENGFPFTAENVIVTSGAKHAIFGALYTVCDPGDEVLFPSPYWNSYPDMVRCVEAEPVAIEARQEEEFQVDVTRLRAALTPKSRVLMLNSPNNPTGAVYTRKTLEAVAQVVRDAKLIVISDDIYEHLVYDDAKYLSLLHVAPDLRDQVIVINGLSKSHCMTGWRLGFAGGPAEIISAMGRFQSQATSHASAIVQHAAIAALQPGRQVDPAMIAEFARRRDVLYKGITSIPGVKCPMPRGAFYILPDFSAYLGKRKNGRTYTTASDLSAALLEQELVATIPGDSFGAPHNIRFTYTVSIPQIEKGLERIRRFFAAL